MAIWNIFTKSVYFIQINRKQNIIPHIRNKHFNVSIRNKIPAVSKITKEFREKTEKNQKVDKKESGSKLFTVIVRYRNVFINMARNAHCTDENVIQF